MTALSLASLLILYPATLFGDGCIVIAIALAATTGGRPAIWGASFAAFHALYGVAGILLADEFTTYSERLGDIFILVGSVVLLRHFMHHSLHHQKGGDCSCENHAPIKVSTRAIISTASAFSLHSLASGAIVRSISGEITTPTLIVTILILSLFIGALIGAIVFMGNVERLPIMRALDSLPGVVATLLTGLCSFAVYHLLSDFVELSTLAIGAFILLCVVVCIAVGYKVHRHRTLQRPDVVRIASQRSGTTV
jgi:hypothetical protein